LIIKFEVVVRHGFICNSASSSPLRVRSTVAASLSGRGLPTDRVLVHLAAALWEVFNTWIPKMGSLKNKSGESGMFSSPNPGYQPTSFNQQSTAASPQNNHVRPPVFAKPRAKRSPTTPQKITAKSVSSEVEDLGRPNPCKLSDCGEWSKRHPKIQGHEVSPWGITSPNILILWGFSRILRAETA
jgi:hypothetical protein